MARKIEIATAKEIELDEYLEYLRQNVDMEDDESVIASAEKLKELNNNKRFAIALMQKELEFAATSTNTRFISHQTMILARGVPKRGGIGFAVRLNFWPPLHANASNNDSNVAQTYSYYYPHDHNFTFLTSGYFGPGYETDLYEWRGGGKTYLQPNDGVEITPRERERLYEGAILFFNRTTDIHTQIPPESLSISLNLLPEKLGDSDIEQYEFDIHKNTVKSYIVGSGITGRTTLIETIVGLGMIEAVPALFRVLESHPAPRLRYHAARAIAQLMPDENLSIVKLLEADDDPNVRSLLRQFHETN